MKCGNLQEEESLRNDTSKEFISKKNDQLEGDIDFQKHPSPTFNIHIHMPPCNSNDSEVYLPQIQPVIHLHFNKIGRRLKGKRKMKNEEPLYQMFQKSQTVKLPKLKDVVFHFKKNSNELDTEKSFMYNETPNTTRNLSNDYRLNRSNKKKKKIQRVSIKNRQVVGNDDSFHKDSRKNSISSISRILSADEDIKIKEARVVLTDILKSGSWKNAVINTGTNFKNIQNENLSLHDSGDEVEKNNDVEEIQDKSSVSHSSINLDNECSFSRPHSPVNNSNENYVSHNCIGSYVKCNDKSEEIEILSNIQESSLESRRSLFALAEGCNFSEILSRFRVKNNQHIVETPEFSTNSEFIDKCNNEEDNKCFYETSKGNTSLGEENCDVKLHLEVKEQSNLEKSSVVDKNCSDEGENPHVVEAIEGNYNLKKEKIITLNLNEIYKYEDTFEEDGKNYFGFPMNEYYDSDSKSDKPIITSGKRLRTDEKILELIIPDTHSTKITSSDNESNFEMCTNKYSSAYDVGNIDLHLHLIRKEMKRRSLANSGGGEMSEKGKSSKIRIKSEAEAVKSDNSSSPKRMKHSNKSSEKKTQNTPPVEDYIPLNASGPTKFAVASLSNISIHNSHSAKNFKNEMLFGNRVNRFSSSDKLRINKLKQEAAKSAANN